MTESEVLEMGLTPKKKKTITVDLSGNGDVKNVTNAIKLADPGDQIVINPGSYKEYVLVEKSVEIIGKIVDGNGPVFTTDDGIYACFHLAAPTKLENITIKDCPNYGIAVEGANVQVTISHCDVSNCKNTNVMIEKGSKALLNKCKIHKGGTAGIWIKNIGLAQIVDCDIFGSNGPNVCAEEKSNAFLKRSKIHESPDVGVWANNSSVIQLDDCEVYKNVGYNVCAQQKSDILIKDSNIHDAGHNEFCVQESSKGRSRGSKFVGATQEGHAVRDESSDVDLLIANATSNFTDSRDGQTYKTAKIGDQEWLAENLNFATEKSLVYYNNEAYAAIYGRMYTWNDAKNAVPQGWHIPTQQEFEALYSYVKSNTQSPLAVALKSKGCWMRNVKSGIGTDEFNFNALPMNMDMKQIIGWLPLGKEACFWTAPEQEGDAPMVQKMSFESDEVKSTDGDHVAACSLRLVKDK
ncbi:MAG: right-handed parallel beta-helix repeat-containing protein [Fibrobacter sp.]|nr:right-handed parallel beta-helix repeat-containing protein [Fibrobacter sp.]